MRLGLLLLVVGCGQPFAPVGQCKPVGFVDLEVADTRPCDCLQRLVDDAVATAEATTGQHQDFKGLSVWLYASDGPLEGDTNIAGLYHPDNDSIELERFGRSLAHELMHRADMRAGATWEQTAAHTGWKDRGWLQAGDEFWRRWSPDSSTMFCF